ncbi:hypothetical protein H2198_007010 [Neophaeococcomyces mojaviensis]|uniref:Uncharacterized protein n=1 Tax=Neophaeococcomyces mojaviensis TaxID=3383035 RepID=A0ACC3A178_9EURO|nr:hypothetical protein H2198_007010 [Knufia sp. JES_112]
MRPLRFVVLVFCFIAIPVFLTCISLFGGQPDGADVFQHPQRSRIRALFSFSTPSSLFPPSAIISLTTENSTFFLARPAAFGPSLPTNGLSGQLWIGRGFGDDSLLSEDDLKISGFELGCSDVPGWGEEQQKTPDNPALNEKAFKKANDDSAAVTQPDSKISSDLNKAEVVAEDGTSIADEEDGTDDHLHRPLQDSNPASPGAPGEPANVNTQEKPRKPTHADIESLQESADIAGKIVMLSRGGCGFLEKVKWAQRRGGIALIVGDNERNGQLTIMYAKGDTSNVTIPAIFTSYTSAHLLSSLVPPDLGFASPADGSKSGANSPKDGTFDTGRGKTKNNGPMFTTSPAKGRPTPPSDKAKDSQDSEHGGWMQNVLQAVGFDEAGIHEDSRRPPGMGNIEWVQVKDWDEDQIKTTTTGTPTSTATKITSTSSKSLKQESTKKAGNDDFVIGVQDWRDTELIAPKSPSTATGNDQKAKAQTSSTSTGLAGKETALKGGSIIPGSGEYVKPNKVDKSDKDATTKKSEDPHEKSHCGSFVHKIKSWFSKTTDAAPMHSKSPSKHPSKHQKDKDQQPEREGLWVTLTPTSVSTSPFFDTLLVLVVSPLVTLTFVYGLLLLRSRIRRRRWRAPKSVVERLPVRTYHTMSIASSTTSSELPTPDRSQAGSPQLRPEPVRARQRSQTTIGVLTPGIPTSQVPPVEKHNNKPRPKRYRGRQVECVVCLEEYVDGESKVMSLPCGHEFHAECITPWLVNRRRTCPICKGDVVRSMQRQSNDEPYTDEDNREPGEETADGVQERAATTLSDDSSAAAIPIPDRPDVTNIMDEDIERGEEAPTGQENARPVASRWRGILNASVSGLSGDTLWRSNSVDRNR